MTTSTQTPERSLKKVTVKLQEDGSWITTFSTRSGEVFTPRDITVIVRHLRVQYQRYVRDLRLQPKMKELSHV